MAGIFQNGLFSMGFDMDPTAAQIFTQAAAGSASSTTPFGFGYSWQNGNTPAGILFGTTLTTVIAGFRFNISALPSSGTGFVCTFYDATAGAIQVALRINSAGQLQFYLGSGTGTTIGAASAASTIVAGTWYYIECLVTISATVGVVTCNVNGTQVINATGQNTKSTANAYINAFQFQCVNTANYDDWYMLDTTGTSPLNTFLGPVQVRGEKPNANSAVGGRNAWTPTNPTNVNYENVGNIPASASEYDYDNNPGDYDMFRFPALPSNVATVLAVNEWALVELDSSGARTVELDCYSNGTDSPSAAFTPAAGTPTYYNQVSAVDPHTSAAWTVANAGAAELGVKVQS
jgi:hypothetical protein